jgi:hypothetical protein
MANPPDRGADPSRQPELEAYRGIFVPGNYSSSEPNLGMHWSTSRRVAEEMVSHAQHQLGKTAGLKDKTVIYNAIIPESSVETDVEVLKSKKVLSPEDLSKNKEKEIPVKAGKPVKLKSKSTTTNVRTRVRTYKPPREVPA